MTNNKSNKETIKAYNRIAKSYSQINYQPEFWLDEFEIYKSLLPGRKIIDIGCGTGRDAVLFTRNNFSYLGIDASGEMLNIARKICPKAKFLKTDFCKLKPSLKDYDGFWAAASLLHTPKN